jgi:hypothetical protein
MKNPWFIPYLSDFLTTCYLSIDCVFLKTAYGPSNILFLVVTLVILLPPKDAEVYIKNLSDKFPIQLGLKQGDALSPLLFNFTLEHAISSQENPEGLILNGIHHFGLC